MRTQQCEVCGVLMHELLVARARALHDRPSQAASRQVSAEGRQARKRREAEEAAGVGRAIDARIDDVCEAEAAFIICNPPGRATGADRESSFPAGWDSCKDDALRRCEQVREQHHDDLIDAIVTSDQDSHVGAAENAVAICARELLHCTSRRAGLHVALLAERAAEAAAASGSAATRHDEL